MSFRREEAVRAEVLEEEEEEVVRETAGGAACFKGKGGQGAEGVHGMFDLEKEPEIEINVFFNFPGLA